MSYHGVIYKFTNLDNGKVYIGMTRNPVARYSSHLRSAKAGSDLVFHKALRKYGAEKFSMSIIGAANDHKSLQALEIASIDAYKATNRDFGYNRAVGGDGLDGTLIAGDKNPMKQEAAKEKHRGDNNWTRKPGADLSYLLGDNNPAKRSEVREKISLARRGKEVPKLQGANHPNAKSITFMGKKYGSIMDAVRDTGYSRDTVSLRANTDWTPDFKKQNHVSKTDPETWAKMCAEASKRKSGKSNVKICGGNNVNAKAVSVKGVEYSSIREAADAHGVHPDTIRNWIKTDKAVLVAA